MARTMRTNARLWLLSIFLLAGSLLILKPSLNSKAPVQLHSREILDDLKDLALLGNVSTTESTCKKGVRCKLNACCGGFFGGEVGTCGFGPDYCGDDCDSQCDAKAECGKYAAKGGMTKTRKVKLKTVIC